MLLPPASGSSPHPPVSVCGTGPHGAIAAFLDGWHACFATLWFAPRHAFPSMAGGFSSLPGTSLVPGFPFPGQAPQPCPCSSGRAGYRNFRLFPIGYGSRPRLRPRLTQGRSALPWKPRISGRKDSHLTLATHSGILSSWASTAPYGTASPPQQCSPTGRTPKGTRPHSFGVMFQPRTFSARDLSTSELLRTLLMNGCF